MNTWLKWTLAIVIVVAAGGGGFWLGQRHAKNSDAVVEGDAATTPAEETKPIVAVQTVPIQRDTVRQKLVAYGSVMAHPNDVTVVSVPFESRVGHLLVTAGEEVDAGHVIGEIAPSPDTQLQIRQAKAAVASARKDLTQTEQRFGEHLATNSDLLQSQQNLDLAQLKLDSFTTSGATESQQIKAQAGGIISKIDVQEGQIVPAGGSLVEIAAGNRIVARLGIEPQNVGSVHKGDPVALTEVRTGSAASINGTVVLVTKRVDNETRLVDVFVSLPKDASLMLEGFVRGELTAASTIGLKVPRDALLPGDDGFTIFTVKDGKAVKHKVDVGLQNDIDAIVTGDGLNAGDPVVIVGNYELEDGMAVTVPSATTQPATTEPAAANLTFPKYLERRPQVAAWEATP